MRTQATPPTLRVMRPRDLMEILGVTSRTTLYRYEDVGLIPPRRQFAPGVVGWLSDEIDEFLRSRPVIER